MRSIHKLLILVTSLLFFQNHYTQNIETQLGNGIDITNPEINEIFSLWKNYLSSNPDEIYDNPYWNKKEKNEYVSYDLLKSEGFLNPSLYGLYPKNIVLYIKKESDHYIINSLYYWIEDNEVYPLAVTNVVAKKELGKFKLYNQLTYNTSAWSKNQIGFIEYYYYPDYKLNHEKAIRANKFLKNIHDLFGIEKTSIKYYIARNCDDIHKIKGFEYVITMGQIPNICAFYDTFNNIIYTTEDSGAFHKHELIRSINSSYPEAHSILLSGLSVYTDSDNSHLGKPLLFHLKKLKHRIDLNPDLDLKDWNNIKSEDLLSEPYYIIGAIMVDFMLEKGGIDLLKKSLSVGSSNEDVYNFFMEEFDIDKQELGSVLKKRLYKLAAEEKMKFFIAL